MIKMLFLSAFYPALVLSTLGLALHCRTSLRLLLRVDLLPLLLYKLNTVNPQPFFRSAEAALLFLVSSPPYHRRD